MKKIFYIIFCLLFVNYTAKADFFPDGTSSAIYIDNGTGLDVTVTIGWASNTTEWGDGFVVTIDGVDYYVEGATSGAWGDPGSAFFGTPPSQFGTFQTSPTTVTITVPYPAGWMSGDPVTIMIDGYGDAYGDDPSGANSVYLDETIDATELIPVDCAAVVDVNIPASICVDDEVSFTFGPGCTPDPEFDNVGISGFGFVVYDDPATPQFGDPLPAGGVGADVFIDPNYVYFATNGPVSGQGAGGCDDTGIIFPPGFFNVLTGCDPFPLEIGVFGADVLNLNNTTPANPIGCDIIPFTMVLNPTPTVPSLEIDGCVATITGACPEDVLTLTGGNGSGSAPGNVVTYSLDPEGDGEVSAEVDLDITNGGGCTVPFIYTSGDVLAPTVTCPATAACMTEETVSADLVPEDFLYLFVDVTGGDSFLDEISIDVAVNGGAVQTVLPLGTFPNGPTEASIVLGPILLGTGGSYTIDITVNDSFGDGLSFPANGTITIYSGQDATGAVLFTASGNYGTGTGTTGVAVSSSVSTTGVWSGDGITTDNGDGTAVFMVDMMNGTYTSTYTYTDLSGCVTTATCDIEVSDCPEPDIPTVGEWGLIILGLLMSIAAVVGIRQRREEGAIA